MKKMQSSLPAKIFAVLLLALSLWIAIASTIGIAALVEEDVYVDEGDFLRREVIQSAVYRTYYNSFLPLLEVAGSQGDPAPLEQAAEDTNLLFTVTTTDTDTLEKHTFYTGGTCSTPQAEYDFTYQFGVSTESLSRQFSSIAEAEQFITIFSHTHEVIDYEINEAFYDIYDETATEDWLSEDDWATVAESEPQEVYVVSLDLTYYKMTANSTEYSIHIQVPTELTVNDTLRTNLYWTDVFIQARYGLIVALAVAALLALASFVFLLSAAGHKAGVEGLHLNWVDRLPLDLLLATVVLAGILVVLALKPLFWSWGYLGNWILAGILAFLGLLVLQLPVLSFATRLKAGAWWKNTVIYRGLKLCKRFFRWLGRGIVYVARRLPLIWKVLLVWTGILLAGILSFAVELYPIFWALEVLLLTPLIVITAIDLRRLQKAGEQIAQGNLTYQADLRHMLPVFRRHGANLNGIRAGMQQAVEVQMRSERMKAELITNVSHDIKTPLTSIVNYVDLLKKDGLSSPSAPEYLEVLDRQSARLKKLTEDLIEASKASTGNIPVQLERTDVHVLLSQAVGEYGEKLQAQQLETVFDLRAPIPLVWADGRLLWRIFDNLLGNVCKYALEGTRVYFRTEMSGNQLAVSFLNVSRNALNISSDELMERFVRGDTSRNTEGSGLGLSIAKSLTELQNGCFGINIDDDFFKAFLLLPCAPPEAQ